MSRRIIISLVSRSLLFRSCSPSEVIHGRLMTLYIFATCRAFLQIMAWVSGELDDRTQAPDSDSDGVVNRTE